MRKSSTAQWVYRVLIYILGLFFMAIGVAISVNANLGISPVNSLPYVISQISGFAPSSCVIGVFSVYILAQIVLLRREFKWINLTQLIFSTIFGYFVDFAKWLLGLVLSLALLHRLDGVREGTIIAAAVVTGKIIAVVKKPLSPLVQKICFGSVPAEAEQ